MWILSKDGKSLFNSNRVKGFHVEDNDLVADGDVLVAIFGTEYEAMQELKQIYDALIAGQESYSVG